MYASRLVCSRDKGETCCDCFIRKLLTWFTNMSLQHVIEPKLPNTLTASKSHSLRLHESRDAHSAIEMPVAPLFHEMTTSALKSDTLTISNDGMQASTQSRRIGTAVSGQSGVDRTKLRDGLMALVHALPLLLSSNNTPKQAAMLDGTVLSTDTDIIGQIAQYVCDVCPRSFTKLSKLDSHKRRRHLVDPAIVFAAPVRLRHCLCIVIAAA